MSEWLHMVDFVEEFDGASIQLGLIVIKMGITTTWCSKNVRTVNEKLAYNSVPPIDLIVEANDQVETSEAILFYAEKAGTTTKTNSTYGIGWEFMGLILIIRPIQ